MRNTILYSTSPDHAVWRLFKTARAKALLHRPYETPGFEVLPGLHSEDPAFLRMTTELNALFVDELANARHPDGMYAVRGAGNVLGQALTVAGVRARRANYINSDMRLWTEAAALPSSTGFKSMRDERTFIRLLDLYYAKWKPSARPINGKSNQGLPFCTSTKGYKAAHANFMFRNERAVRELMEAVVTLDMEWLLNHNVVPCYMAGFRAQADKFGKDRKVSTLELASGESLKVADDDKKRALFGDAHQACRVRTFAGLHNILNLCISGVRHGFSDAFTERYAATYKVRSREDLEAWFEVVRREMPAAYFQGRDVGNFDTTSPYWLREYWYNYAAEAGYVPALWAEFVLTCHRLPVFHPDMGQNEGPVFIGDFTREGLHVAPPLKSGIDDVSDNGKIINTFNDLVLVQEVLGRELTDAEIDATLRGKPVCGFVMKNMGDDGITAWATKKQSEEYYALGASDRSYLAVEPEDGMKYLGMVCARTDSGTHVDMNPESLLYRTFVPERAWYSKMRRDGFRIGLAQRFGPEGYLSNPELQRLFPKMSKIFGKHFPHLGDLHTYVARNMDDRGLQLSHIEAEFIDNPDVVRWKYDVADIPRELYEEHFVNLDIDLVTEIFGGLLHGL